PMLSQRRCTPADRACAPAHGTPSSPRGERVAIGMSEDGEIFKAASRLIEQHGEAAAAVASHHMTTLREQGDLGAAGHWGRIIARSETLQRQERPGTDGAIERRRGRRRLDLSPPSSTYRHARRSNRRGVIDRRTALFAYRRATRPPRDRRDLRRATM